MPDDKPIAHTADGRPLYDNTPTVVCLAVHNADREILVVRRAKNPGAGLIALPGGFHMRGETWQEAGVREVLEETGAEVSLDNVQARMVVTDEYGHNLIIADAMLSSDQNAVKPADGEATEVLWISPETMPAAEEWAFPLHMEAVERDFAFRRLFNKTFRLAAEVEGA